MAQVSRIALILFMVASVSFLQSCSHEPPAAANITLAALSAHKSAAKLGQPQNSIIIDLVAFVGCDDNGPQCVYHDDDLCRVGCEFEKTKIAVESVCNAQQNCTFDATNQWFGGHASGYKDPAEGHKKIVLYQWTCHGVKTVGPLTALEWTGGIPISC
jgi:hypothetical protein